MPGTDLPALWAAAISPISVPSRHSSHRDGGMGSGRAPSPATFKGCRIMVFAWVRADELTRAVWSPIVDPGRIMWKPWECSAYKLNWSLHCCLLLLWLSILAENFADQSLFIQAVTFGSCILLYCWYRFLHIVTTFIVHWSNFVVLACIQAWERWINLL